MPLAGQGGMPVSPLVSLLLTVTFLGASKPSVSSWPRAVCEKTLITLGLWEPPVRALIYDPPPYRVDKEGSVLVQIPGGRDFETFHRTNRDQGELIRQKIFPYDLVSGLRGLKVLDLACGDGLYVEQMRRAGVDIVGLDVFLTKYQKSREYFVQAGADKMPFPGESFDLVISSQGPLTYSFDKPEVQRRILREIRRVLKPGGRLRVSPLYPAPAGLGWGQEFDLDRLDPHEALAGTPLVEFSDLKPTRWPDRWWMIAPPEHKDEGQGYYWLELERN